MANNTNSRPIGGKEPANKDSLGYIVWQITSTAPAQQSEHAARLGISSVRFSSIIHGHNSVSQQAVANNNWQDVFATHYPDGWAKHKDAFLIRLAEAPLKPGRKKGAASRTKNAVQAVPHGDLSEDFEPSSSARTTIWGDPIRLTSEQRAAKEATKAWRVAAGQLIAAVVDRRGDDAETLASETNNPALKATWARVMAADPAVPSTVYKAALTEVVHLYALSSARDLSDVAAYRQIEKLRFDAPL